MGDAALRDGKRNFILIFMINLLISISFQMLNPTLPKYVVALGLTTGAAGVVSTAFVVTSLIIRPFSGRWSGQYNLKTLMYVGLACLMVAMLGYLLANNMPLLIVCRLIHGLGWGISTTTAATIAAQSLPEKRLGSGIGVFGLASCISNAVAPNIGLALSAEGKYFPMFMVALAIPAIGLILCTGLCLPVVEKKKQSKRLHVNDFVSVRCLIPVGMVLMLSISVAAVSNFLALYADELQVAGIGVFFTVYAVSLFIFKPLSGRLADKLGFGTVIYGCAALMVIAFMFIGLAKTLWEFLMAAVLYGAGYGGLQPTLQAWSFRRETPERRGVASSTFFIGLDAGTGIGASIAGVAAQLFGYQAMYLLMIVPIVLSAVLYAVSAMRKKE